MLQRTSESPNAPFTLFQREGTRNWSMRYSLGGRQIKKSLGIADYDAALQRANEIYHEQKYRHKQGLSLVQHPFCGVAEEFIEKVCAEAERDERSQYHPTFWPPIIRRFPVGYFGDKAIDLITTADVERYLEWRKTYWTTGPGSKIEKIRCEREDGRVFSRAAPRKVAALATMKGEMVIIRELFRQASRWGYCKPLELPTVEAKKKPDNRRPGFKPEEYEKLIAKSTERINEHHLKLKVIKAKDGRVWTQKTVTEGIRADRVRLHAYIELMANSGLRPTEAKNLTWGDISPFLADKNSAQQGLITAEPYEIQKQTGVEPKIFLLADSGYKPYATMITVQQNLIDTNPDLVQRFVDASIEGWYNYLYGDNAAANALIKTTNPEMTDGQIGYAIDKMKQYGIVDSGDALDRGIGCMTAERYQAACRRTREGEASQGRYRLHEGI